MIKQQLTTKGNLYHKYLITEFWNRFGGNKNCGITFKEQEKLDTLIEFSNYRITYHKQQPLAERRSSFISKFGNKKCFVCLGKPECRHHILQLKNGGINARKNIVLLCHSCHRKVHPWL